MLRSEAGTSPTSFKGPYRIIRTVGLIVLANSNIALSGNGRRLELVFVFVPLSKTSTFSLNFAFLVHVLVRTPFYCFSFVCSGASNVEMFLVLQSWVRIRLVRDSMPQVAGTVPLGTDTGVHAFLFCSCVLQSRRSFAFCWLSRATNTDVHDFQANQIF